MRTLPLAARHDRRRRRCSGRLPVHPHQSKGPVWTPATIFLVTDHLYHLLVKNYMRRDKASGAQAAERGQAGGR